MRREQRQAPVLLGKLARDRPRQREAVERRRPAADLVDQHQAVRRRAEQDRRRFGHLDHERRPSAGQVVGRADARVDRVERPDGRRARRHERAAVREQRDHRGLAHVRRLAAHVRARDDEQPPLGRQVEIVGDEGVDLPLDDRMPPAADREAGGRGRNRGARSRAPRRARRRWSARRARRAPRPRPAAREWRAPGLPPARS